MRFPPLFKLSSSGKPIVWAIRIHPHEEAPAWVIEVTSGYVEGKQQVFPKVIYVGKNIGKSNETSPMQQAEREAKAMWEKQRKSGYVEDLNEYEQLYLPMLAHDFREHSEKIHYAALTQPKLEGIRCLIRKVGPTEVRYISRENNLFLNFQYMTPYVREILAEGEELDGELYCHRMDFEDITSLVKKPELKEEREQHIQFFAYDFPMRNPVHTADRIEELERRFSLLPSICPLELVPTHEAQSEEEVYRLFNGYVEADYEGIIVRNKTGPYEYHKRSYNLQKYKEFIDEEFLVVDVRPGVGKFENQAIFICRSKINHDDYFDVVMKGRKGKKEEYLRNRESIIGKMVTVQYQRLTKYGLPYLPVGIAIRDYE